MEAPPDSTIGTHYGAILVDRRWFPSARTQNLAQPSARGEL
jgi:hypothetical protein